MGHDSIIYDNSKRADILTIVFWTVIISLLVGIVSSYMELILLEGLKNGEYITEEEANTNDTRQQIIGILQIALHVTSVVVFLNWFRRAYGNLHRLGDKTLKHSETMTIWGFVIPIVCYFWPYQIMSDIWVRTQHHIKNLKPNFLKSNDGYLIGIWWALFVISAIIGKVILRTVFKDETIDELMISSIITLVSDALQIIEALILILIVQKISKMEKTLKFEYDRQSKLITLEKPSEIL